MLGVVALSSGQTHGSLWEAFVLIEIVDMANSCLSVTFFINNAKSRFSVRYADRISVIGRGQ